MHKLASDYKRETYISEAMTRKSPGAEGVGIAGFRSRVSDAIKHSLLGAFCPFTEFASGDAPTGAHFHSRQFVAVNHD